MNVVWNCVKYTMKVAAVCLSTTHAKSAMGLSWKWRHRVIRVIIWRPRPRPHQPSLCIARSCRLLVIYLKKKMSKSWYVTMCIANKLKKYNKYVFISCRPQKTSVLGHKSGFKKRWQTLQSSRRRSESGPAHSSIHPRDAERPWAGHNRSIIQWPSCF